MSCGVCQKQRAFTELFEYKSHRSQIQFLTRFFFLMNYWRDLHCTYTNVNDKMPKIRSEPDLMTKHTCYL